jgi:UrcA family protein
MNARVLLAPVALLCATVSLGSAVAAGAQTLQPRTARVTYADLDLASAAGRASFERRVDAAADSVCRLNGYVGLAGLRAADACHARAVADAMSQVMTAGAGNVQFASVEVRAKKR